MKFFFFILISFLASCCCTAQQPYSIRDLKGGRLKDDKPGFAGLKDLSGNWKADFMVDKCKSR